MAIREFINTLTKANTANLTIALAAVVGATIWIYWPGLYSTFLFDDIVNLQPLGENKELGDYDRLMKFVFSGISGPTGRPISLASMLINDYAWPSTAFSFKYTNLLIHCLNGLLVFWLGLKLVEVIRPGHPQGPWIALFSAAIWLLHPFQLSTVLYVIQRMTQLSSLFTLAALILYVHARGLLESRPIKAYILASLAITLGGTLAILSKESGILLVVYALVLEIFVLRHYQAVTQRWWNTWVLAFLVLPIVALATYIAANWSKYAAKYEERGFDLGQRLLSESRVMSDYLYNIFVPKVGGGGLYHDDFVASQGLFSPGTTFIAILFLLALILLGILSRKRYPLISFAIFWFFAAHLLESTVLPLELYFEHRNYLALFGFCFLAAFSCFIYFPQLKKYTLTTLFSGIAVCALFTGMNARLWGTPITAAFVWAEEHPKSVRAIQDSANYAIRIGKMDLALKQLDLGLSNNPMDSGLILQRFVIQCSQTSFTDAEYEIFTNKLQTALFSHTALTAVTNLAEQLILSDCKKLDNAKLQHVIETLLRNHNFSGATAQHLLYYKLGELFNRQGLYSKAIEALDKSFANKPVPQLLIHKAYNYAALGNMDQVFANIAAAREVNKRQGNMVSRRIEAAYINQFENKIREQLDRAARIAESMNGPKSD